ncbi:MFS general substrate transporter [Rhizodiscina lignyota]|uniref:MFS general substrate transporter n=1 Tax=Rhizodiscina lignyota TaxID=1504668 RepID=A0A9P4M1L7_9PEZI|nr:MFS general substrate transporter [Rhizodiscina lignyota]
MSADAGDQAAANERDEIAPQASRTGYGTLEQQDRGSSGFDSLPRAQLSIADNQNERSALQTFLIMLALWLSVFVAALDTTIISTALTTITNEFRSSAGYIWVPSAFMVAAAAATPTWGKWSDIWGRRPVFLLATAVFFVGSLICALAKNMAMLIAGRAIQGVAAGGLITLTEIVISDLFSMRERAKYYGLIGTVWAFASGLGPVVGGALSEKVSWRWCFYINLPITGLTFAILLFFLDLQTPRTPLIEGLKAIDWLGSLSSAGGTVMILLGLQFGGVEHPWKSVIVICLVIFGGITFTLFIAIEWKVSRYPIMPVRLFKSISNAASLLACFFHGVVYVTAAYYLALYFQAVLGSSPILAGVWLLPYALALALGSVATGAYIDQTGCYLDTLRVGFFLMTLGTGLFIDLPETRSWAKIIIYQILGGAGGGPGFQAPLLAFQAGVSISDRGTATNVFGFIRYLANAVGVSIGAIIVQNGVENRADTIRQSLGDAAEKILSGGSATANIPVIRTLPVAQQGVVHHVFNQALRNVWILLTVLSAASFGLVFFIDHIMLSAEHEIVRTGLDVEEERRKENEGQTQPAEVQN